jgi:hypothetical protein
MDFIDPRYEQELADMLEEANTLKDPTVKIKMYPQLEDTVVVMRKHKTLEGIDFKTGEHFYGGYSKTDYGRYSETD